MLRTLLRTHALATAGRPLGLAWVAPTPAAGPSCPGSGLPRLPRPRSASSDQSQSYCQSYSHSHSGSGSSGDVSLEVEVVPCLVDNYGFLVRDAVCNQLSFLRTILYSLNY